MRDWNKFDKFYGELLGDIYRQPDEEGRIEISRDIISSVPLALSDMAVLDVGCGEGYAQELFTPCKSYTGITASLDEYQKGKELGRNILLSDYNFMPFQIKFDLIFSSHALEHSPFPLFTLMEWHEFAEYLLLINPNPKHYGYIGKNHYSVMPVQQLRWLLRRAGWKVIWMKETDTDLAYLCHNEKRVGSEGWAETLTPQIYEEDRDNVV